MSLDRDLEITQAAFLRAEQTYSRTIARAFADALNDIRAQMSKIYEKYAENGVLTKAQMSQYGRLAAMEEYLASQISAATNKAVSVINRLKPEQYGEAFARNAWALDNATGVSIKWGLLNKDTVIANLMNPAYENAIKTLKAEAIGKVKIAIEQGLTGGKSYATMIKEIKNEINVQAYKALRIMRTELHTAQEAGTLLAYERAQEQGIEGQVIWMATLDDRTRDTHQDMDGQPRGDDGYFDGPGDSYARFPGDPELPPEERINCRCTLRYEVSGLAPIVRRDRESGVIPYQTFNEWSTDRKIFKE